MGGDSACFSLRPVKTRHGSAMPSASQKTIEGDRIDMVKAPIAVQEDVGVYKPFEEHRSANDGGLTTCLKGTA